MQFLKIHFYHPIKNLIARLYIRILRKFTDIKIIAITGSAGKTTTKEMIAAILKHKAPTVWSKDNIDPIYNIPSTLLRCTPKTKYLVLEMGVEKPGEMDFYLSFAKPDVGIITNIFPTHTEFLKSTQGVFEEKSKLVKNSKIAILNKKDNYLKSLVGKLKAKIIQFEGENEEAAIALAKSLGIDNNLIREGLKNYTGPEHRAIIIKHKSGATIYDDSYNSNPEALLFTLRKFNKLAGKGTKIAVLGDMKELGAIEESEHRRVGREVAKSNFRVVVGVGIAIKYLLDEIPKEGETCLFSMAEEALPKVKLLLKKGVYVLVKGSRSIGLDRVVDSLS